MTADTPDPRPDSLFPPLPEVPQEAYEERLRDWPDPRPVSPPSELTAKLLTEADVQYWRQEVAKRPRGVHDWPDDAVLEVVARFLATLDAARAAPQADEGLREALNLVGECRVQGPHPHAFVGPHRFNEAGSRDVLDEIEDLAAPQADPPPLQHEPCCSYAHIVFRAPATPAGTICKCGLAKSYHAPRFRQDHEYEPRYPAAPAGLDESHAWTPCNVCGAMTTDPEALEPCAASQPSEDGPADADLERELAEDRQAEQEFERLADEMERAGYER